jgi:voltage-gated potassium channel
VLIGTAADMPEDGLHHPNAPQHDSKHDGGSTGSTNTGTKQSTPAPTSQKTRASLEQLNDKYMIHAKDMSWKKKVWLLLEEPSLHPVSERLNFLYSIIILGSVLSMVLGTLREFEDSIGLEILEISFNVLFSIEASTRVFCAPQKKALLYSMYMWMDILAVVPFYVLTITQTEATSHPMLELLVLLVPILRLLKVTRQSSGWRLLVLSMVECLPPLMVPAFLLLLMVVFSSCVLFWMDKHTATEEDGGPAFRSIPHAMWFTICTVSTVGYGDVSPNSDLAKSGASLLILLGVCYMAMPLAIVSNTFSDIWANRDQILIAEKAKIKFAEGGFNKQDLQELFAMTDADGSGTLSRKEFVQLIDAFGLGFTRAQIKKLFKTIDDDSTGSVNFKEFGDFLFPDIEIDEDEDDASAPNGPFSPGISPKGKSPEPQAAATWAETSVPHANSSASADSGTRKSPNAASDVLVMTSPHSGASADAVNKIPGKAASKKDLRQTVRELQGTVDQLREDMHTQFEAITRHLAKQQEQCSPGNTGLNGASSAG